MTDWYPTKHRIAEIEKELARVKIFIGSNVEFDAKRLLFLSDEVGRAMQRADFPIRQVPQWLWLASLYRSNAATDSEAAVKAAVALHFLDDMLSRPVLRASEHQELSWVLDETIDALSGTYGNADLTGCLSKDELKEIHRKLSETGDYDTFDAEALRASLETQLVIMRRFDALTGFENIDTKIDALFAAAVRSGRETDIARAALRYLAEEDDIIPDHIGILGLMDDLYVIEHAYSSIGAWSSRLVHLDEMLRRWPFISNLLDASDDLPVNRYAKLGMCAALSVVSESKCGTIFLQDTGAFPLLAALSAGLEHKSRVCAAENDNIYWPEQTPIIISDGTSCFHAIYKGKIDVSGREMHRIGVRGDNASILLTNESMAYASRASKEATWLCKGNDLSAWAKNRHPDPDYFLSKHQQRRPKTYSAILLIGPRWKLDDYLEGIRIFGDGPAKTLGICRIDSTGKRHDFPGTATDRPLIYACADILTAEELIRRPPDTITEWTIIVDGADCALRLAAYLRPGEKVAAYCVFAAGAERETASKLLENLTNSIIRLEPKDVLTPSNGRKLDRKKSAFTGFFTRQPEASKIRIHSAGDHPFLEMVADSLATRPSSATAEQLRFTVAGFLRHAISSPFENNGAQRRDASLTEIARSAATLAPYDLFAADITSLFAAAAEEGIGSTDRIERIAEILRGSEAASVAVLCRSASDAARCAVTAAGDPLFDRVDWLSIEALRRQAPYELLVVASWPGTQAIRDLANHNYAVETDFIFYAFERAWFERVVEAAKRFERRIQSRVEKPWARLSLVPVGETVETWDAIEPNEDLNDVDIIEQAAAEAVTRSLDMKRPSEMTLKARCIFFEAPGRFALLPSTGKAVVLSTSANDAVDCLAAQESAERFLLRRVAEIEPGMLLALPESTDGDLIDARADLLLDRADTTRQTAGLWKAALKRRLSEADLEAFIALLADAGEKRNIATVRCWLADSKTIAPRNYRRMIPLIADLLNDGELSRRMPEVFAAVEAIYKAREQAAATLVREIFSGAIDLEAPRLEFNCNGKNCSYLLERVRYCGETCSVRPDMVSRVLHLSQLPLAATGDRGRSAA